MWVTVGRFCWIAHESTKTSDWHSISLLLSLCSTCLRGRYIIFMDTKRSHIIYFKPAHTHKHNGSFSTWKKNTLHNSFWILIWNMTCYMQCIVEYIIIAAPALKVTQHWSTALLLQSIIHIWQKEKMLLNYRGHIWHIIYHLANKLPMLWRDLPYFRPLYTSDFFFFLVIYKLSISSCCCCFSTTIFDGCLCLEVKSVIK